MADDPRKPYRGANPPKAPRPITERGAQSSDDRDRLVLKHELGQPRKLSLPFEEEEATPVTMIKLVREELKSDIETLDNKIDSVEGKVDSIDTALDNVTRSVERLSGEVSTTNRFLPQMLGTIRDDLRAKRTIDEHVMLKQIEVAAHREITQIDSAEEDKRTQRKIRLKRWGLITSVSLVSTILTLLATRC